MMRLIPIMLLVAACAGAQTYPVGTELRLTAVPDTDWTQGAPNSRVTIWTAREGQPQQVVMDHDLYLAGGGTYGRIWLLPYMTSKDATEVHPEAHVWYDELIVSREFIGDPI